MHILGLLGTVVTILWLLHRLAEMGIDLAGLNPFLWRRRRRWRNTYQANPIFKIDSPLEATALLVVAVAKADGDMSSKGKRAVLDMFEEEFHLSKRDAAGLLTSSSFLLGTGEDVRNNVKAVLAPSLARFTSEQADSAMAMFRRIAEVDGLGTPMQRELVERACEILGRKAAPKSKWEQTAGTQ